VPDWIVVLDRELRDLWLGGRGLWLLLGTSLLLGAVTYMVSASGTANYLEQREAASLALQIGVVIGSLLVLLAAADAVSGERERETLETLLLAPIGRGHVAAGKLLAAISLWFAGFAVSVPYVWFLGRGVGVVGIGITTGLVAGTLVAVSLGSLGLLLSLCAGSNRVSLSVSLLVLLALFAPTQVPSSAQRGRVGELFQRVDPITSATHLVTARVVNGRTWGEELSWLVSPVAGALLLSGATIGLASRRLRLAGGLGR
jgi:ABC-2 type transport system permease protein